VEEGRGVWTRAGEVWAGVCGRGQGCMEEGRGAWKRAGVGRGVGQEGRGMCGGCKSAGGVRCVYACESGVCVPCALCRVVDCSHTQGREGGGQLAEGAVFWRLVVVHGHSCLFP
jgi:hypothetical protein